MPGSSHKTVIVGLDYCHAVVAGSRYSKELTILVDSFLAWVRRAINLIPTEDCFELLLAHNSVAFQDHSSLGDLESCL